ncbi:MAG: SHOCT domain-containing protein [Solirubrobacterales bacterium]
MAASATSPDPPESRHRIKVRILLVAASVFAFLAIFTAWIDRQLLDTDEWVETSGELLEEPVISDAIADYAVDQLYSNVDVASQLQKRLPEDLKPLAPPASGALRELGTRVSRQALQQPRVQGLWKDANRVAHSNLVEILEGDNETVSTETGHVVLDLRPIVLQLADRLGLAKQVDERLPADVAELEIAEAEQLQTARTITRILKGLAWLFSLGTLALFAAAAFLAKGRRWMVVLAYGLGLVAAGLAAIALRGVAEGLVVDELADAEAARPPAEAAWTISTNLLGSIATSVILYGVLFSLASFLASPATPAIATRQALAPSFRERPGVVWGVFAAAAFVALITWPPSGPREAILTFALIALAAAGVEALSRKSMREFPDARSGDWWAEMRRRSREARTEAGRRVGAAIKELGREDERHPDDTRLERLERLGELKAKGVLTAAEFRVEKKRILADVAVEDEQRTKPPAR